MKCGLRELTRWIDESGECASLQERLRSYQRLTPIAPCVSCHSNFVKPSVSADLTKPVEAHRVQVLVELARLRQFRVRAFRVNLAFM